jgi:GNAT superfamily N-acetyltransferase
MTAEVTLRPAVSADRELLLRIYASSRATEMATVPWTDAQKAAFLREQYDFQECHYRSAFEGVEFSVIVIDGDDAGRLIVHRGPGVIEIMDIALLEAFRGRGTGTRLVRQLMDEAAATGRSLRLWVEEFNPARRLYERLGFFHAGHHGIHMELVWPQPNTAS